MPQPPDSSLFADAPPRAEFALPVPGGHVLHVRELGAADGVPLLLLHGGPGSGWTPLQWRFFDPTRFRIIAPDQRGAGRSRPAGGIQHNTTADLLADLRALRRHLRIDRWCVVGGSWGAALALAHALDEPAAVRALVLRSTFLARQQDIDDFFRGAPRGLAQLANALHGGQGAAAAAAACDWWAWERERSGSLQDDIHARRRAFSEDAVAALVARYQVQSHYLQHACWLNGPPLLQRLAALPRVPTWLLHGTVDRVCPPEGAAALHAALPHSRLQWVEGAGHDLAHAGMQQAMGAVAAALLQELRA